MKNTANRKPTVSEEIPFGVWVKKGKSEHMYGIANMAVNMQTKIAFLNLNCDCGAEPIVLGMNLDTLKDVSAGLARAVAEMERDAAAPEVANVH